ncbi:urease accessory protein UreF [Paenibacillus sp. P96]|uniref:Urease accessory protein UreF n=1 Tax=Paenibacillus zeirhizosphaerae TaxID=2987519 RepID=A0ABT9FVX1_9BACL|nr:urease accessory UreF family protein [Paenibacillus sp. P96]MDP4098881.1 urease accessory protein UreF [Paenibacillus sp. P96]
MSKSSRLLHYAYVLDPCLPVGSFPFVSELKQHIAEGSIKALEDVEAYMKCHMHCHLVSTDGMAIKGIYAASKQYDGWRIALIDKMLHAQRTPRDQLSSARTSGQRLLKLGQALYPWIDFKELEKILQRYKAIGSLPTVHAWINFQLGVDMEQAVSGYLNTAVNACVEEAAKQLNETQPSKKAVLQRILKDMEQEWGNSKDAEPVHFIKPFPAWNVREAYVMNPLHLNKRMLPIHP